MRQIALIAYVTVFYLLWKLFHPNYVEGEPCYEGEFDVKPIETNRDKIRNQMRRSDVIEVEYRVIQSVSKGNEIVVYGGKTNLVN